MIKLLDQLTINKISAGEVIERPSSVVKELVENSIDSGANAITVEIKEGGLSFIRITDNGSGIEKDQIKTAFLRHATSKINTAEDLTTIGSLGFRGEALASIAAVAQVEMITKIDRDVTGVRYLIEGGTETTYEEIGCPEGTTIIVRNLFFNTPARRKFMKTPATEGSYIAELINRLALSRPDVSFKFISNGQNKLYTSGNNSLKDVIYNIYDRDISKNLLELNESCGNITLTGYIAKPYISRGNRTHENYFVNNRYIKSSVITKAIEEAYQTFVMVHKYPFTALKIDIDKTLLDINVHPTKMELKISNSTELHSFIINTIRNALTEKELIPQVAVETEVKTNTKPISRIIAPEPFETKRIEEEATVAQPKSIDYTKEVAPTKTKVASNTEYNTSASIPKTASDTEYNAAASMTKDQVNIFDNKLLSEEARPKHRLIGQLFKTYWLIEYENKLFIMDQHAAHEKIMFEELMHTLKTNEVYSQNILPPIIISLSPREIDVLIANMNIFSKLGFVIEEFGGNEYVIRAVPSNIMGISATNLFEEFIGDLLEESNRVTDDIFVEKLSTMACKAAIKGNNAISFREADALIDRLLTLENPYNCPHGRPTLITMSEQDIEKKFRRIQN